MSSKRLALLLLASALGSTPSPARAGTPPSEAILGQPMPPSSAGGDGLAPSDLASLRAAIEAHRHAVSVCDDGFAARNTAQRWDVHFDGRAFSVEPDAGDWTWGLELLSYGRRGTAQPVDVPARVETMGPRLSYAWDSTLTEWYLNDRRGIEHGYTLSDRPAGTSDQLELTLAVRGDLEPRIGADGRSVAFVDAGDRSVVDYSGLTVFDADGATLPARFVRPAQTAARGAALVLVVDDSGARYPLTIDPVAQQAYLKASNSEFGDAFGVSLAISGDTVVVGANSEDGGSTGVNGNQANGIGTSGAAYVFVRNAGTWSQQAYLKASNTGSGDNFGNAVAISGDTIVVGAFTEDSNATGVDGDQSNNALTDSGAAYVFVRTGSTWSQQAYLKSPAGGFDDYFGLAVAVSGDTVVVGAHQEDSNATGIDGNAANNSAFNAGAAYVFVRNGSTWSQQAYLKGSNTSNNDQFGRAVAASGDIVVIGAFGEDSNATGVNGDQASNAASSSGAAYVFVRSGTTWSQQAYLKASNTESNDQFGFSVAASGERVVVGAFSEDSSATGVDGNGADNSSLHSGAAYVFTRSGTVWSQEAYLKASNTGASDAFGWSVAISGNKVIVGARQEGSAATGIDGNQADDSLHWAGAAYLFEECGGSWSQLAYLKASNTGDSDEFGAAVSISGDLAVAGAQYDDSPASGIDGFQGDDFTPGGGGNSGAAYVFFVGSGSFIDLGNGLAGNHAPVLTGSGCLLAGTNFSLSITGLPTSTTSYFVFGLGALFAPFKGGVMGPTVDVVVPFGTGSGSLVLPATTPPGIPSGTSLYLQSWTPDAGGPVGFDATNVLQLLYP